MDDRADPDEVDALRFRQMAARHQSFQQFRRKPAFADEVGLDAGEPRLGVLAEDGVVVHAEDADFGGDLDVALAADVEDLEGPVVARREDAAGFRQVLQPCGERG